MSSLDADNYVTTLAGETQPKYAFSPCDLETFGKWQSELRAAVAAALGLDKIRERPSLPLDPKLLRRDELPDHIREEYEITTEPGFRLSFYVLRPKGNPQSPQPLVITPHGHGKDGKDTYAGIFHDEAGRRNMESGERDIALQAVREGYLAIAPDMRGFCRNMLSADIKAGKGSSCRTMHLHALLFGRTLLGERVWDIMKVVDFALAYLDIDPKKIAITGNSGGGTASLFAAAVDPRLTICIPSCCYCSYEASWGAVHHCECGYIPGIMNIANMYDIAGLIAPRPLLIVAGKDDHLAPIEVTKKAYQRTRRIYETVHAEHWCRLYIGDGGHRYYKAPVWPFVREVIASQVG